MQQLAALAAVVVGASADGGLRRSSWNLRWLSETESKADKSEQQYIWGGCDAELDSQWDCELKDGLECGSHLSEGPTGADISVTISNLPPSTNESDVHMAWWAARQSVYEYSPLRSPHGCAVYQDLRKAYPMFNETAAFNGGNLRVSESGEVTVQIRQPATYVVDKWVLFPHIHLRLCTGEKSASLVPDTIFFTRDGPHLVRGFHGHDHDAVLTDWSPDQDVLLRTPPPSDNASQQGMVTNFTSLIDFRIEKALDALDLDALEFSPVYRCLLRRRFYSYFTSSCVEECPVFSDVHIGQCVRKETAEEPKTIEATWRLKLECQNRCFHDKLNVTMHHLRLAVADRLNIPFQDVWRASLIQVTSRRLEPAGGAGISTADMVIAVRSKRIDPIPDGEALKGLLSGVTGTSWLLGFIVHEVKALEAAPADEGDDIITVTDSSDPYAPAYADAAESGGVPLPGVPGGEVPIWAVVTGVVLVLLACAGIGTFLWFRRKKQAALPNLAEVQGVPVFQGAPPQAGGKGSGGGGDGDATKPSTVGAPLPDDDAPPEPDKSGAASSSAI